MFDSAKAYAAQEAFCGDGPNFSPGRANSYRCPRCKQNIYAEYGHPVVAKLRGGRVELAYGVKINGISVEQAGRERVTGCPYCHWSFCD